MHYRIQKKALNMKSKGKCPRERPRSRWEQVKKDILQKEERRDRKRGNVGRQADGQIRLPDDA
jgi:hypothetical protein